MTHLFVTLEPRSSKARNRLANSLGGNPLVLIEQIIEGKVFAVSPDRSWCSWISTTSDPHWNVNF